MLQNKKNYRTILFDLDGTLIDSMEGVIKAVNHALTAFGMGVVDLNSLRKFVGPPIRQSFKEHCGFDDEKTEEIVKVYRKHYTENGIYEHKAFPGIPELLKSLKSAGKTLAVATSKTEFLAVKVLENLNLAQYFTVISGCNADGSKGTKEEVVRSCLDRLNVKDLDDVVLVGDTIYDIVGARKVGIDCIAVLYGYGSPEVIHAEHPTHIVESVEDLGRFLLG